ncbi:MAG: lipoyl(octanoyl) transferase [Planctomycetes bacterium RIFCSPHIGHO2_02_FULL_38_41]|nr:MAG: lipoyl(octanoyl) transferase [Planctomycetes bacterium RIFCSPHIGHO2_02_FULL_38_41]OHB98451.1 MAG: lipoyl(octanoyl) transferase [Planctomycetes bacterium RIFCSPLOWO2_12_38_17]
MSLKSLLLQLDMVEYGRAWELQKTIFESRINNNIEDCLILLQHPPTFTYGRRYKESNLTSNKLYYENKSFAVYKTDRGGLATYHGPGQIIGYPILKMSTYTKDYYQYLRMLEEVMIRTLSDYSIWAIRRNGYTGVWVNKSKIGFIGVRIAMGYTMHGFSLNVNNDLNPFNHIIPCGIQGVRITSISELLNADVDIKEVFDSLVYHYSDIFRVQVTSIKLNTIVQKAYSVMAECDNLVSQ